MIGLIMDFVLTALQKISASGKGETRSRRRDRIFVAATLAVVLTALCTGCLIRGWQTNDAYYLFLGFLVLGLTICETARMIRRCRKR